jgi:tyrosine-protein kinase Etk/Wzc
LAVYFGYSGLSYGAFLFNRYATPIYKVESTVIVEDEPQALGTDLFQAAGLLPIKSNVENEIGILKSYAFLQRLLKHWD